jgi:hypothetical protein
LCSLNSASPRKASTPLGQNGLRFSISANPLGQNGGRLWIALLLIATTAHAGEQATATIAVYADDNSVTVVSPTAHGGVTFGPVDLSATAGVDVVSAASVDIVSAASPRGFHETRVHAAVDARWAPVAGTAITAGYALSSEPDFLTHGATLGASRDILDRAVTLGLNYGFGWSRIGRVGDPVFAAFRQTHQVEASWSQVLSPTLVLDLAYGLTLVQGYQASPYRFVRLYFAGDPLQGTAVAERTPDFRARNSGTVRIRARLAPEVFSAAEYTFYADSWGMIAHTASARASFTFATHWTIVGEARGHTQTGVSFYKRRYETLPEAPALRTAEKEFGPMWTILGSLHLDWMPQVTWAERFRVGLGADFLHMRYLDHPLIENRNAVIGMFDVSWEY